MKKILLFSLVLLTALVSESWAQADRTISGKVTSAEDASTLPGVNVVLKGTTNGTITDVDGNYTLSVPSEGGTLTFSFIGLATEEVEIGSRSVIDLAMSSDVTQLSEIVVTALGIEREARSIGYAIDGVDAAELTKARSSNIVNSLQGKVTGVSITQSSGNLGASSRVLVRGVTSLSGRNSPLWVVDGVPINDQQTVTGSRITGSRDFAQGSAIINPDDVASISVLKGAAATALYGSRAAAGAIIVTSKSGESNADGSAQVAINSSVRFDGLFRVPDYQQQYAMGSGGIYDSSSNGFDWGPRVIGQTVNNLPVVGGAGPLTAQKDNGVRDFFEQGVTLINNVSVSDADAKSNYRLSLTSLNQSGIIPGANLDRITIGLNTGTKHSEKLKTGFGIQYVRTISEGTAAAGANSPNVIGLGSFSSTLDQNNYKPWIDEAGNQINTLTPTSNNPFWIRNENHNDRNWDRFIGNFNVAYSPIEKLKLTARLGYDYEVDNRFFSNRKGTAQRILGDFTVDNIERTQLNFDGIASYGTDINEDLELSTLVGFNYNRRIFTREGIFSDQLAVAELFDPGNAALTTANRNFSERILMGLYGQAVLSYKNWLSLTLTARNDWSSTLPLDNNSYFYPSVSAAFVFTDAFEIANDVLSYGKLRASLAQVGNDGAPYQLDFSFIPVTTANGQYSLNNNFPFNGAGAFTKSNRIPAGQSLRPEEQTSWEIGGEFQLLDGRFGLDVSYFQTQNKDQILALPIPQTTGFGTRVTNVGQVDNEGIEISLDAKVLEINDFTWNSTVNFSQVESTVTELAEGVERVLLTSAFNSIQVLAVPGLEFQLNGIDYLRDTVSGRPIINPTTGRRQSGETKNFGSVLPDFTMGFVNNFSYKGISVGVTIDWRDGGVIKSSTVESLQTGGLGEETLQNREGTFIDREGVLEVLDGTTGEVTGFKENDVPLHNAQDFWTALNNGSVATPYIFESSYVKLREIAISYALPSKFFENSFIRSLQVGVEGRNLALLYSKVPHIDPEASLFGSGSAGFGVERANSPSTRSFGFNVNIRF